MILVGEIRDDETVKAAIAGGRDRSPGNRDAAHHDVSETITRIIDFFPPHQAQQVRVALAGSLAGVISQRLLPPSRRGPGSGDRGPCIERSSEGPDPDPDKTHELQDIVAEGSYYGMQTFDQALLYHVQAGRVAMDDAMRGHPPARLQAARELRRPAPHVGRCRVRRERRGGAGERLAARGQRRFAGLSTFTSSFARPSKRTFPERRTRRGSRP